MSATPRRTAGAAGTAIRRLRSGIVRLFGLDTEDAAIARDAPAPSPPGEPPRAVPLPPVPPMGPPPARPVPPSKALAGAGAEDAALDAARQRERERCAAIVTSPAGLKHPALACSLAFRTRLSRGDALALLEVATPPSVEFGHLEKAHGVFHQAGPTSIARGACSGSRGQLALRR